MSAEDFEGLTLNVSFDGGTVVQIDISGYENPLQVIKALEKLGRFEYLESLYGALTDEYSDEWEEDE